MLTVRYVVRGQVQGVGFRYFTRSAARGLGVAGWVRNAPDGSVEALAAAGADVLEQFEARLRLGPSGARVESVSREPAHDASDLLPFPFVILSNR